MLKESIYIQREIEFLFDLSQDYEKRLKCRPKFITAFVGIVLGFEMRRRLKDFKKYAESFS